MKKYLSLILVVLVCFTMLLSGCNLTSIDSENYNSKIVAKYGTMEINKREFSMAYNSNGSNYINNGDSAEVAAEKVVNDIINRKLLIEESKKEYGVISLTEKEYNALEEAKKANFTKGPYNLYVNNNKYYDFNTTIKGVYDYVNEQVLTFENEIRKEKGMDKVDPSATETKSDDASEFAGFTDYVSSLTYKDGKFVKKVKDNTASALNGEFVLNVYGNSEVSQEALHRYLIKVRNSNPDMYNKYSKYADILKAHILDLFPTYQDNRYTTIIQEEYEKTLPINEETVLSYYKTKVEESYTKYNTQKGYDLYVTDMQSDPSNVYWHYEGSKGFVLTAHVLIKFDDVTVLKLKNLKTDLDEGKISENYYNDQRTAILNSAGTYERDPSTGNFVYETNKQGEKVKKFLTYNEIYEIIETDLKQYDHIDNDLEKAQKKAETFNKYVYMYGMDSGSINSNHYYACNLDTSVKDSLVENYANKTRELYKNEGIGSLSTPVLVEADNYSGYHIILVVNESKNLTIIENINKVTIEALNSQRPMLGINKTMLDIVYDSITKESYNSYHDTLVSRLRKEFAGDSLVDLFVYNYKSLID